MGWMLVVSENETFQREAMVRFGSNRPVVGATGDASARGLVKAVDVDTILVDSADDVGARFLSILRRLPGRTLPGVNVIVVGPQTPQFETRPSIASAALVAA